jgi:hypothetical protein
MHTTVATRMEMQWRESGPDEVGDHGARAQPAGDGELLGRLHPIMPPTVSGLSLALAMRTLP